MQILSANLLTPFEINMIDDDGNSKSVILGLQAAQIMGMKTIGMTGNGEGVIHNYSNYLIDVPSSETPRIQELHIPIYHYICQGIEKKLSTNLSN